MLNDECLILNEKSRGCLIMNFELENRVSSDEREKR